MTEDGDPAGVFAGVGKAFSLRASVLSLAIKRN